MEQNINRRKWLKNSALLTGGITFLPSIFTQAATANKEAVTMPFEEVLRDADFAPPFELKARLFANENPFGPSDAAKKAVAESLATSYQYAFRSMGDLVKKITSFEGITEDQLLMDSGSSQLLLAAAQHFSKNGGTIITANPTYDDLPRRATGLGAKLVYVPLTADYKYDLDAMEQKIDDKTSLVYICNPNNPTGTVIDREKLKAFCERVSKKVPVFVDEAYIDYLDDPQNATLIESVKKGQNIIVARTFSKLYGFAGLRMGYIVAQPAMIKMLEKYTNNDGNISAPTIAAATASFKEQPYCNDVIKKTNASKEYLYSVLKKEGYDYIPSSANFVLFPIKMEGKKFTEEMMKRGVGLRFWKFNNKEWCRISIGRMDEMEAFAKAFKEIS